MLTNAELESIEARWVNSAWTSTGRYVGTLNHRSAVAECRDQNGNFTEEPLAVARAAQIASAPSDVCRLAHEVRRLQAELDSAKDIKRGCVAAVKKALDQTLEGR